MIEEAGSEGRFIQTDAGKTAEIERLFDEIASVFGRIDYAFNNAGIENPLRPLAEQTEEDFDRVISINLKSVWLCMKHEINQMLKRGGGAIVNNSSIYRLVGVAMQSILRGRVAQPHVGQRVGVGLGRATKLNNPKVIAPI